MPSVLGRQGNLDASVSEEEMEQDDPDHPDFEVIDIDWKPIVDLLVIPCEHYPDDLGSHSRTFMICHHLKTNWSSCVRVEHVIQL